MSSLFTRIIKREIPGQIVWEDAAFAVIMDMNPIDTGHLLVVPKREEESLFSLSNDEYHDLWEIVRWLEAPLRRAIGSPRIGIAVEGFGVPHVHIHMVPVYRGNDLNPHRAKRALPEELAVVASRIRSEIEKEPNPVTTNNDHGCHGCCCAASAPAMIASDLKRWAQKTPVD